MKLQISYPKSVDNPYGLPLPKQLEFHNLNQKYKLYAGSFGGGKSLAVCYEVLLQAMRYPNNYILLARKHLSELGPTTLMEFLQMCPKELILDHNKTDRMIKLINNSIIYYTGVSDDNANEKLRSLNLGAIAVDEVSELTEEEFLMLISRLRRLDSSRQFFGATNPSGRDWMWRRFILNEKGDLNYGSVITTIRDNKYLTEDYVLSLMNTYPKQWCDRFLFASFEDFEGAVYSEFNFTLHVTEDLYSPTDYDTHYIVLDYGFRNPTAILYMAIDYDGKVHVYDEYYKAGKLISEISEEVKKNQFWRKATLLIDPSSGNVQKDGRSVADEFRDNGLYFLPAINDVKQGIDKVNTLFRMNTFSIGRNCVELIKEIGDYKWKSIRPGQAKAEYEEPIKVHDHACDCLRYFANHITIPKRTTDTLPEWFRNKLAKNKQLENKYSAMAV